jgi:hypothetical protein
MAKKKSNSRRYPGIVEELAQVIEKGLERFPENERKTRLDNIHLILSGASAPPREISSKRSRVPAKTRTTRRRAARS